MSEGARLELIDSLARTLPDLVASEQRRLPHLTYADVRVEIVEVKSTSAENDGSRSARADTRLTLGVRALAGERMVGPGYVGLTLGVHDTDALARVVRESLAQAHRRALVNGEMKADTREKFGVLGRSLVDTRLHPVDVRRDRVAAVYEIDPREVSLDTMSRYTLDVCRQVGALDHRLKYRYVSTLTQLSRELFVSTEGALIDQAFALTQGLVAVVAVSGPVSQELDDVLGHQRGWEILVRGVDDASLRFPPFREFALDLARESLELVEAPALPSSSGEVIVVTDPHYNTLLSHEIVGHPVELDRALKMETAYAGRSWLLRGLGEHQVGRRVASPLVTAYSDPALPGYGHYAYDHEGTPGRRVVHIDQGILKGFMNSRQTVGDLRRRAERTLEGGRPLPGTARPHVDHGVRGRRAPTRRHRARGRPRLLHRRASHPVHRREPRELPHFRAERVRDRARSARAPLSRRGPGRRQSRLPHERGRSGKRLPDLPDR